MIKSAIIFLLVKMHIVMNLNDVVINMKDSSLYYENTEYIYKGINAKNYILFNNELWRIINISDKGIKIMKNESIGKYSFDENNTNKWGNSTLYKYLNNTYYNNLQNKSLITSHTFETTEYKGTPYSDIPLDEKTQTISKVGLISLNEFLLANDNKKCDNINSYIETESCKETNYINEIIGDGEAWSITSDNASNNLVISLGNYYFGDSISTYKLSVYPAIYLNRNISLSGSGTKNKPYYIKKW